MNRVIQASFLAVVFISLALSGCSRSRGDDSSLQPVLSFQEPIVVGNPEHNPAGPYLLTSKSNKVLVSWVEVNPDGVGGSVFLAQVTHDGQQLTDIRKMNHEPIRPRGGEHKSKFTLAQDDNLTALWVAHTMCTNAGI